MVELILSVHYLHKTSTMISYLVAFRLWRGRHCGVKPWVAGEGSLESLLFECSGGRIYKPGNLCELGEWSQEHVLRGRCLREQTEIG